MPIDVFTITDKQADQILSLEENHFSDLKGTAVGPAKLTKALSAFANADGGELYIGVDEDKIAGTRTWNGFPTPEAANGHLQPFEQLFPLGQDFQYEFLKTQGRPGLILKATIAKTLAVKYASDQKAYVRRGAASLPTDSADGLRRLVH